MATVEESALSGDCLEVKLEKHDKQQTDMKKQLGTLENLQQVLEFLQSNLNELNKGIDLIHILPVLHIKLMEEIENISSKCDLNSWIKNLLQQCQRQDDDDGYGSDTVNCDILLSIIYQILTSVQYLKKEIKIHNARFNIDPQLIYTMVLNIFDQQRNSQMISNVLACWQLYCDTFQAERTMLTQRLWLLLNEKWHKNKNWQVLVELYDDFVKNIPQFLVSTDFYALLSDLLQAEQREQRKAAYYLMKKIIFQWNYTMLFKENVTSENNWSAYITILENIEANQSHLIMPALSKLQLITTEDYNNFHLIWKQYLHILFEKLLNQQNILVKRWTIEFLLKHNKYKHLSTSNQVLFLNALNATNLYNIESYVLPYEDMETFFDSGDFTNEKDCADFFNAFTKINWKPVPFHFCLSHILPHVTNTIFNTKTALTYKMLLDVASCIRKLNNKTIRNCCLKLFKNFLRMKLNLYEFCKLIETLYNETDEFVFHNQFSIYLPLKMMYSGSDGNDFQYFSRSFCELINPHKFEKPLQLQLIKFLMDLPAERHGYMRLYVVFLYLNTKVEMSEKEFYIQQICKSKYDLDIQTLIDCNTIKEVQEIFQNKLLLSVDDLDYIREKAIDFFIFNKINGVNDLLQHNIKMDDFLDMINEDTMHQLIFIFLDCLRLYETGKHEFLLFQIINKLNITTDKQLKLIYVDLDKIEDFDANLNEHIQMKMLNYIVEQGNVEMFHYFNACIENKKLLIDYYFSIDGSKVGDARIELIYINQHLQHSRTFITKFRFLVTIEAVLSTDEFLYELLAINQKTSFEKPRYFHNSPEHHVQMRIVHALLYATKLLTKKYWNKEFWQPVLQQNNQLDITMLYELYIAKNVPNFNIIMEKLENINNYTASRQISIITIAYYYFQITGHGDLIKYLLPLTMGANFQVRLYAQLYMHEILSSQEESNQLFNAISDALGGNNLDELKLDLRVRMPFYLKKYGFDEIHIIGYVTDAPIDEYSYEIVTSLLNDDEKLKKSKELFQQKITNAAKSLNKQAIGMVISPMTSNLDGINLNLNNNNIQRKIEPLNNLVIPNNLLTYPYGNVSKTCEDDVYVVASLIDKYPNLGGIARTCEVFGIKNLVLNAKCDIENIAFKNLSMTAEQYLNIFEVKIKDLPIFLKQKQLNGYKVIGAEQVSYSQNFVDFKFPKKCIILLGQEKEGIPANLLSFLDYAVEIPQFGNIRSLNVHVTGALFMWEYRKQNIIKQHTT